jgi:hypothetical protein
MDDLHVPMRDAESKKGGRATRNRSGRGYPAPRSAPETEAAHRRQLADFQHFASRLGARLTLITGSDAFILVGGAAEWSRLAASAIPRRLHDRLLVTTTLDQRASPSAITRAAKRAARQMRSRLGREMIAKVLARVDYRAVAGVPALQRAIHAKAVDLLLVSPRFLHLEGDRAEQLLQSALGQGARIEVLSGDAAALLDQTAQGVAARLRFAIDPKPEPTLDRLSISVSPQAS